MTTTDAPATPPALDYRLYDADEHYYEPEDALTRHLDRKYRNAVRWVDMDGRRTVLIGGKLLQLVPNPTYDPVGRPGSLNSYFRAHNEEGRSLKEILGEPQPIQSVYAGHAQHARQHDRSCQSEAPPRSFDHVALPFCGRTDSTWRTNPKRH